MDDVMKWSEYAAQLSERGIEACKPTMAVFELTPLCNFNCYMCFIHLTPEQARAQGEALSTEEWLRIARDAKRLGVFCIEVTGGEAVTRPDFPILYEAFIKMGYLITLRSNGYLLRGETLKLLKKYKPASPTGSPS